MQFALVITTRLIFPSHFPFLYGWFLLLGHLVIIMKPLFRSRLGMSTQVSIRRYSDACHGRQGSAMTRRSASRRAHVTCLAHTERNISGYVRSQQAGLLRLGSKTSLTSFE